MEFFDVVNTRRSIRSYKDMKIPEDSLMRVIKAASIYPNESEKQLRKFYIVENSELKEKIAKASGDQMWIAKAPIIVVAVGWMYDFNRGGYMGDMSFIMDVGIAFTHLVLAARAEGLGTCWIGRFSNEKIKKILGLPDDEQVVALTPMGYPGRGGFRENPFRVDLDKIMEKK